MRKKEKKFLLRWLRNKVNLSFVNYKLFIIFKIKKLLIIN